MIKNASAFAGASTARDLMGTPVTAGTSGQLPFRW